MIVSYLKKNVAPFNIVLNFYIIFIFLFYYLILNIIFLLKVLVTICNIDMEIAQ